MSSLVFLIVFEIIIFCFAYYISGHDIMAPSCIMCIMFIISSTFALLNVKNWKITFSLDTCIVIISGLFVYVSSEMFFRYIFCGQLRGETINPKEYDNVNIDIKSWIVNLIILFDLIVIFLYLRSIINAVGENMMNLSAYFHAYRLMGINSMEYIGESITSGPINFLLKFVMSSGYLSAYMLMRNFALKDSKMLVQIKYIIIIILSIMPSLMTGGRTGILKMFTALLVYYYICWHQKNGWNKNLSVKYIKVGFLAFFIIAPGFYYSLEMLGRVTNRTITDYISDYLASSICLLDQYIKNPVPCTSWGEESLVGVIKILSVFGICEPSTKYNLEFRPLGIGSSNVYTFFRRPLHDFGYLGMYIFVILIAFFFSWMYYKKIKYRLRMDCVGWVIAYGYFFYWIMCSSIVQYSVNMISVGAIVQILIAVFGYKLFAKESIK